VSSKRVIKEYISGLLFENDLEDYRQNVIRNVRMDARDLLAQIRGKLPANTEVAGLYIYGSVLDANKFRDDSDIDLLVIVKDPLKPVGDDKEFSELLAGQIYHPDVGAFDITVMNNAKASGAMKIA
jgi:predicted nucleotidyltransferase